MDLQGKLKEAMKAKDELARDMLRVIMGEVSVRVARTGKEPPEEEVFGIIRKIITNNQETRQELEKRGQAEHEAFVRLGKENAYLETLLPRSLSREEIQAELASLAADLKSAKADGQATGLAMKHLKSKGLNVQGDDVSAVVKTMRAT